MKFVIPGPVCLIYLVWFETLCLYTVQIYALYNSYICMHVYTYVQTHMHAHICYWI